MIELHTGDCLDVLKTLPDCSVDAIVTDPPYGLSNTGPAQVADVLKAWVTGDTVSVPAKRGGFMGEDWDSFVPPPAVWEECARVLKPGGHMAVFAGARTQDLMGLSIRLAGFEIREGMGWIYGSGFPKSHDIGKAIDKYNGNPLAFREFAAAYREAVAKSGLTHSAIDKALGIKSSSCYWARDDHRGGMPPRHHWETVRDLVHVSGELERLYDEAEREVVGKYQSGLHTGASGVGGHGEGGEITTASSDAAQQWDGWGTALKPAIEPIILARKPLGGASRLSPAFKYQAKAPKKERPVIVREDGTKIQHATVKPLALMEWLVELITPPGGVVLDPFAGSGTTLEAARNKGFSAIGIERESDYIRLIETRLGAHQ